MLRFHQYQKSYGTTLVVSIPELQLEPKLYWLQGENGSGKTTLLKSIAGLIPFEGEISVNGFNIRKQRRHYKRLVNYAEAEPLYPPFLTGNDLLQFYLNVKGGNKQQTAELMQAFGIDAYIGKKVGLYSSGMAKKLSLLLAFIGTPALILLDEPLITLDKDAVAVLHNCITKYHQNGVAVLATSHQEFFNPAYQVRPLLLKKGALLLH